MWINTSIASSVNLLPNIVGYSANAQKSWTTPLQREKAILSFKFSLFLIQTELTVLDKN